jgi:hypothetical protein
MRWYRREVEGILSLTTGGCPEAATTGGCPEAATTGGCPEAARRLPHRQRRRWRWGSSHRPADGHRQARRLSPSSPPSTWPTRPPCCSAAASPCTAISSWLPAASRFTGGPSRPRPRQDRPPHGTAPRSSCARRSGQPREDGRPLLRRTLRPHGTAAPQRPGPGPRRHAGRTSPSGTCVSDAARAPRAGLLSTAIYSLRINLP